MMEQTEIVNAVRDAVVTAVKELRSEPLCSAEQPSSFGFTVSKADGGYVVSCHQNYGPNQKLIICKTIEEVMAVILKNIPA